MSKIVNKKASVKLAENDARIRKYPNRRLYCPVENRYLTQGDVWQRVKDKRPVEVVDKVTGTDITKHVLLEIVHRLELIRTDGFSESALVSRILSDAGELEVREFAEPQAKRSAA